MQIASSSSGLVCMEWFDVADVWSLEFFMECSNIANVWSLEFFMRIFTTLVVFQQTERDPRKHV